MADKVEQFIRSADRMPSIPSHIEHLLQTINDPNVAASNIEKMIVPDAALSMQILRISNSAFYYRMTTITRISDALTRLGFKTTRSLIVTVWTHSIKQSLRDKNDIAVLSVMLAHGTACAVIAKALLERVNRHLADDAFLAALMHDMGKLALMCQLGQNYNNNVLAFAEKNMRDIPSVELDVLGFDHCVLGARLMEAWHLPSIYKETAKNHHAAEIDPAKDAILAAVTLADTWATALGHNVALNAPRQNRDELAAFFNVTDIPQFKEECENKIVVMTEILNS